MGGTPHDVPSAALFTQAAKASIRSLQPSAPFSATLEEQSQSGQSLQSSAMTTYHLAATATVSVLRAIAGNALQRVRFKSS